MAQQTITTAEYILYPSPRNEHREVFEYHFFVLQPYALIDLPSYPLTGRCSLFAAHRKADGKMGQLVTFEHDTDRQRFEQLFEPD